MSTQSDAKKEQRYVPKVIPNVCGNCSHFMFDTVQTYPPTSWKPDGYFQDKNMRCGIGGFAVKKMGCCTLNELKQDKP